MSKTVAAWALVALGLVHIAFGFVRFKLPLAEAFNAGFVDQFKHSEARRAAFWFLMCGPLLVLAGHLALRALAAGDPGALRVIGFYALGSSLVGIAAFPASPLWSLLLLSLVLIAC